MCFLIFPASPALNKMFSKNNINLKSFLIVSNSIGLYTIVKWWVRARVKESKWEGVGVRVIQRERAHRFSHWWSHCFMKNDVLCSRRCLSLASGGRLASLWVIEIINNLGQGRLFMTHRCIHKACDRLCWNNIIGPAVYSALQNLLTQEGILLAKSRVIDSYHSLTFRIRLGGSGWMQSFLAASQTLE